MGDQHPLNGLRVLEMGSRTITPYIGKLFTDAGADVLKVESPEGDPSRSNPRVQTSRGRRSPLNRTPATQTPAMTCHPTTGSNQAPTPNPTWTNLRSISRSVTVASPGCGHRDLGRPRAREAPARWETHPRRGPIAPHRRAFSSRTGPRARAPDQRSNTPPQPLHPTRAPGESVSSTGAPSAEVPAATVPPTPSR